LTDPSKAGSSPRGLWRHTANRRFPTDLRGADAMVVAPPRQSVRGRRHLTSGDARLAHRASSGSACCWWQSRSGPPGRRLQPPPAPVRPRPARPPGHGRGLYATLRDTEQALAVPRRWLSLPSGGRRAWSRSDGERHRRSPASSSPSPWAARLVPRAVVAGVACLGLLVVEPIAHRLAGRRSIGGDGALVAGTPRCPPGPGALHGPGWRTPRTRCDAPPRCRCQEWPSPWR
jgi:hypothetical protein